MGQGSWALPVMCYIGIFVVLLTSIFLVFSRGNWRVKRTVGIGERILEIFGPANIINRLEIEFIPTPRDKRAVGQALEIKAVVLGVQYLILTLFVGKNDSLFAVSENGGVAPVYLVGVHRGYKGPFKIPPDYRTIDIMESSPETGSTGKHVGEHNYLLEILIQKGSF